MYMWTKPFSVYGEVGLACITKCFLVGKDGSGRRSSVVSAIGHDHALLTKWRAELSGRI